MIARAIGQGQSGTHQGFDAAAMVGDKAGDSPSAIAAPFGALAHDHTDAISRMAFTPDVRSGDYLMRSDTLTSLSRLF